MSNQTPQDFDGSGIEGNLWSYTSLNIPREVQDNSLMNNSFAMNKLDSLRLNNSFLFLKSSNGNMQESILMKPKPNKLDKFMTNFNNQFSYIEKDNEKLSFVFEKSPQEKNGSFFIDTPIKSVQFVDSIQPENNSSEKSPKKIDSKKNNQKVNKIAKIENKSISSHENEKTIKCKLKSEFFLKLSEFFYEFFTKDAISEEGYILDNNQEKILSAFFQRRYSSKINFESKSLSEKFKFFNETLVSPSNKRPEECYKYLLIRAIKFLKIKLAKSIGEKFADDEYFYQYYFSEKANEYMIDLKEFYYPFMRKADSQAKLNSRYFERIKLSQQFTSDCQLYLNNFFFQEHCHEVKKKLSSLFKPFDSRLMRANTNESGIVEDVRLYILNNKHSKFPWTLHETDDSVNRYKTLLSK